MNAPPPYYAPAGPRKSNVGLIIAIVVGVLGICCVLPIIVSGFFFKGVFDNAIGYIGCGMAMQQERDGLVAYAKANGGKLPDKEHWQDDIAKYLKPMQANQGIKLPPENGDVCDEQAASTVTYNEALAGKKLSTISDPGTAIVLWETPGKGRNRSAKFSPPSYENGPKLVGNFPRGWIQQPLSGTAFFTDQNGNQTPVTTPGRRRSTIDVNVGGSKSNGSSTSSSSGE